MPGAVRSPALARLAVAPTSGGGAAAAAPPESTASRGKRFSMRVSASASWLRSFGRGGCGAAAAPGMLTAAGARSRRRSSSETGAAAGEGGITMLGSWRSRTGTRTFSNPSCVRSVCLGWLGSGGLDTMVCARRTSAPRRGSGCSFLPLGLAERFGRRLGAMGGRNRALPAQCRSCSMRTARSPAGTAGARVRNSGSGTKTKSTCSAADAASARAGQVLARRSARKAASAAWGGSTGRVARSTRSASWNWPRRSAHSTSNCGLGRPPMAVHYSSAGARKTLRARGESGR